MLIIRLNIIFSLLLIFDQLSNELFAQTTYKSKDGSLAVTGEYLGYVVVGHTKNVEVLLDYESATFTLILVPAELHTGIDSLDLQLHGLIAPLILNGKLSLGRISTTTHAPQSFNFSGTLETAQNLKIEITGVGWLKHIGGGEELACELAFYFDIDVRSVGLHKIAGSAGDEHLIKVQFFETILRRAY